MILKKGDRRGPLFYKMNYTNNRVSILRQDEVLLYSDYFIGDLEDVEKHHHFKSLVVQNTTYLLLLDYERVQVIKFLVNPLTVAKIFLPKWNVNPIKTTSVKHLVKPHVRRYGRHELRPVDVEGSYIPFSRDNVFDWDSDRPFKDEYLDCPLKKVSIGDVVFVVPFFHRYKVLSRLVDSLGFNLVPVIVE